MKIKWQTRYSATLLAVVLILGGVSVMYTGVTRGVILGEERYFVGGAMMVFGIYFVALAIKKKL
jgi:hypothetical protein